MQMSDDMGMVDAQWKAHLRGLIKDIEQALKLNPDNAVLQEMLERFKQCLAD